MLLRLFKTCDRSGISFQIRSQLSFRSPPQFNIKSPNTSFIRSFSNNVHQKNNVKVNLLQCSWLTRSTGLFSTGLLGFFGALPTIAFCEAQHKTTGRLTGLRHTNTEKSKFDWPKFWTMLKPDIWTLAAAIAAALVVALINIKIPLILGGLVNIISKISSESEKSFSEQILSPGLRLVSYFVAQSVFTFVYISLLSGVGERVAFEMKNQLFASLMSQDLSFFDEERTGELMNRLTTDVQNFKSAFKHCVSQGLRSGTQIIGCAGALISVSPQMTGMIMVLVPSVIIFGTYIGSLLRKLSARASAQVGRISTVAEEALSNIRTVRAFGMEDKECELLREESKKAQELNEQLGWGIGLFQAGTNLFLNGMVLTTLCMGGYLMSVNEMSAGDVMSFLVAAQTVQRSLAQVSLLYGEVLKGLGAGASVFEYINRKPKVPLIGGEVIPYHTLQPHVKFEDVTFSYPTRPDQQILKNFNLSIPAGSTVAIVGSSGNGKSTVAALLARMYEADSGTVTLGGHDLSKLDPTWLRSRVIGFINQEPVLFATSIKENIRYSKPSATDEEVVAVAKLAQADEFIQSFPEGYDTVVGEKGVTVSGGQKQRIAIARALLKNPSILILDEATSALDAQSEKTVQKALEIAAKGRTVLVIAHRLSTVKNADQIVVLQKGVIVEMGTHEELQKKKGYYWSLVQHQELMNRQVG